MNFFTIFWAGLALLFIGLKLGGVIAWSWAVVLLPVYALALVILVVLILGFLIATTANYFR